MQEAVLARLRREQSGERLIMTAGLKEAGGRLAGPRRAI